MLILIIAISRAPTKLDNVRILKAATKVFRGLLNDSLAINGFLSGKGSAFRKTDLTTMKKYVCRFFFCSLFALCGDV